MPLSYAELLDEQASRAALNTIIRSLRVIRPHALTIGAATAMDAGSLVRLAREIQEANAAIAAARPSLDVSAGQANVLDAIKAASDNLIAIVSLDFLPGLSRGGLTGTPSGDGRTSAQVAAFAVDDPVRVAVMAEVATSLNPVQVQTSTRLRNAGNALASATPNL